MEELVPDEVYDQETKGADSRDKRQAEAVLAIMPGRPWPGTDLGFYKGGCPIHLKGAPKEPRPRRQKRRGVGNSRLGVLGECRKLPQRGTGQSPGRKRICCISALKYDTWWQ